MAIGTAAALIGGAVVGGIASNMAAGEQAEATQAAANTQAAATDRSAAETKRQFDISQENQAPWLDTGSAANNRLAYLMGLGGGTSSTTSGSPSTYTPTETREQLIQRLTPQYTKTGEADPIFIPQAQWASFRRTGIPKEITDRLAGSVVDEAGLNAEIDRILAAQRQSNSTPQVATNPQDGDFGALTKAFSLADFQADPGYNFRKSEGNKEIERNASVLNSGRTLKALLDYNQNIANNEYNNAYTRYNQDQNTLFGRLSDISGKGQATATGMANQSGNYAGTLSNLITSQGDASAASQIAGANATASGYQGIASAINNGINSYQSHNTLNNLLRNNTSTGIAPETSSYYMPANNASGSYFSDLYNF